MNNFFSCRPQNFLSLLTGISGGDIGWTSGGFGSMTPDGSPPTFHPAVFGKRIITVRDTGSFLFLEFSDVGLPQNGVFYSVEINGFTYLASNATFSSVTTSLWRFSPSPGLFVSVRYNMQFVGPTT